MCNMYTRCESQPPEVKHQHIASESLRVGTKLASRGVFRRGECLPANSRSVIDVCMFCQKGP